jgi:hypothetical protein
MRVYLSPSVTKLLSTALAIAAIAVMLFLGGKAFKAMQNDPSLKGIQEILQQNDE